MGTKQLVSKTISPRIWVSVCATVVACATVMLCVACGGHGRDGIGAVNTDASALAPSATELQVLLDAELARLGIDPEHASSAAPGGAANAVFDLTATVIDPDGEGPDDPTGVELAWTERLIGDYDQNGVVNVSDLTPIGQFWDRWVDYDDAGTHDGLAYWPEGDPAGGGAANWRLARVDGNHNGLIETADITPIAQHWQEKVSGYRVYRKAPGEDSFTWLADPENPAARFTIARPEVGGTEPVRYGFTDTPELSGEYEYYVVGFASETTSSSTEGDAISNTVSAALTFTGLDTHPPEWDSTVGITEVTANADGTVTVEWGTASDLPHPPAVANPPVSYTLYYSTETPLDFETAYAVEDAVSPWTSVQLVDGQEYYFAVRAKDSADPPNVEDNTEERSATVTGGVDDEDPPEWTGVTTHTYDGHTTPLEGGLAAVEVGDGKLTIHCAPAEDILSPPVRYDLYYLSLSGMEDYSTRPLQWNTSNWEITPHENAVIVNDISPVYELPWENHHPVAIMVVTKDSHTEPNTCYAQYHGYTAPSDAPAVEIDAGFPWVEAGQLRMKSSMSVCDVKNNICYSLFLPDGSLSGLGINFYVVKQDLLKGTWDAKLIYEHDKAEQPTFMNMALSPNGEIFAQVRFIISLGVGYDEYWRINAETGDFTIWEPGDSLGDWYRNHLGHNGLPATTVLKESEIDPDYYASWYRWYDEAEGIWKEELASDPGGELWLRTRPDGVMQAIVYGVRKVSDSELPVYAQILERSPDGVWTEQFRFDEGREIQFWSPVTCTSIGFSGYMNDSWGNESDWLVAVEDDSNTQRIVSYSYTGGYSDISAPVIPDCFPFIHNSIIHGLRYNLCMNIGTEYADYMYWKSNIEQRWYTSPQSGEYPSVSFLNPHTGEYAYWFHEHDTATGELKYYIRSSYYGDSNIYDPLAPDWER